MKCESCGEKKMGERRGDVEIDEGGVKLALQDVRIFTCPKCGHETHAIPMMEGLFRAVALDMARNRARLRPEEIRFLRKSMGLSSVDFASKMGVHKTTVSKWESVEDTQPMGPQAERVLRLMVLLEKPVAEYRLEDMASEEPRAVRLKMKPSAKGWEPVRAA